MFYRQRRKKKEREKKMKILWLTRVFFSPTGIGKISQHVVNGLAAQTDHELYVFSADNQRGSNIKIGNLTFLGRAKDPEGSDVIPNYKFDAIINYATAGIMFNRMYLYKLGIPVFSYLMIDNSPPSKAEIAFLRRSDFIVPPTDFYIRDICKFAPDLKVKLTEVIAHPVSESYKPMKRSDARKVIFQQQYEEFKDKFVIGYVAQNHMRKGITELFNVFQQFQKKHSDAVLIMTSEPHPEVKADFEGYDLELEVARRGIPKQSVLFVPNIPEQYMPALYNSFNVLAHPSYSGATELPVLESLSCGCPVIATDTMCMSDWITDSKGGLLIKTEQKVPFSSPMKFLLSRDCYIAVGNDSELMNELFGEGYFGYLYKPSEEDILEKMESLYASPKLQAELSRNGTRYIKKLNITPTKISEQWNDLLQKPSNPTNDP